jgi:hypothetical protein
MDVLGIIFLVIVGIVILLGIVFALMALPDYARYRRLRRM